MQASANTRVKVYSLSECQGLMDQGQFDEAKSLLANVLRSHKNGEVDSRELIDTLWLYADCQKQTGHFCDAYQNYCVLIDKDSSLEGKLLRSIFYCLSHITEIQLHPRFESHLIQFLHAEFTDNEIVCKLVEKLIFRNLHIQDHKYELELCDIAQNQLLLKALPHLFFSNPKIEIFLNELRYCLLSQLLDEGHIGKDHVGGPLFEPMAQRAFNNEYICYQTPMECELVSGLQNAINQYLDTAKDLTLITDQMLTLAMYMPLSALNPVLSSIALSEWPVILRGLYKLNFSDFLEEQNEAKKIARSSIGEISNATSITVRRQYEGHPYPRWHSTHIRRQPLSYLQAYPHLAPLLAQSQNLKGEIDCLVAT
jgi:hypothetical protein